MYNETHSQKTNSQIRDLARRNLSGHWGMSILVCFIFSIISSIPSAAPSIGWIISLVIMGPLTLGLNKYFIQLNRREDPQLETLFDGFKNFTTALVLQLLMNIFVILWALLLIIPGIIAALSYSMSFYILNDNPELSAMEALKKSKEMMDGYKGKLLLMYLSFIGWAILCLFTFGIGYLWLIPYIQTSTATFYEDIKSPTQTFDTSDYIEY